MADDNLGDPDGPPVRAFLIRLPEDRIGIEPRLVEVRVVRKEALKGFDDVIAEVDLDASWERTERQLMDLAAEGPWELAERMEPEEDPIRVQLMAMTLFRIKDFVREWQLQMWPDIDQRVQEKWARQSAMRHLPDEEIVLQVCEVNDPSAPLIGAVPDFVAFLLPGEHIVPDGLNFRTVAVTAAVRRDRALLEEIKRTNVETGGTFSFKASGLASDDLVAVWRKRFEWLGLLEKG